MSITTNELYWLRPLSGKYLLVQLVSAFRLPAAIIVVGSIALGIWWPLAATLLLVGLATDFLDGYLARKWDVASGFGAFNDAQMDRLLLISPIVGMGCFGDIPLWSATLLVAGLYAADVLADHFELMRVVWWPLCYVAIAYGLITHVTLAVFIAVMAGFVGVSIIIVATHLNEVKRVWNKLRP